MLGNWFFMFTFVEIFMKSILYNIYKVIRALIIMGIVGAVAIFVSVYLLLLFPEFQNEVRETAEQELSAILDTDVKLEKVKISPFNQVVLENVVVNDTTGAPLLKVEKLGAGLSLYNIAVRKRLVFTYAEIMGLDAKITKETPKSQSNIQFLIDIIAPKDKTNPPKKFDLTIYNIVLRNSKLSYDVLSEPKTEGKFDKDHMQISNLKADIALPRIKNNDFYVKLKRLSFEEKSGFQLSKFAVNTHISDSSIAVAGFKAELPQSKIQLTDFELKFNSLKTLGQELKDLYFDINTTGTYITPKDLRSVVPVLGKLTEPINLNVIAKGTLKNLNVSKLNVVTESEQIALGVNGSVKNLTNIDSLKVDLPNISVKANSNEIANLVKMLGKPSKKAETIIRNCGIVDVNGVLRGTVKKAFFKGDVATVKGKLKLDGDFASYNSSVGFKGHAKTDKFNVGALLDMPNVIGETAFDLVVDGVKQGSNMSADVVGDVSFVELKGYRYHNIAANLEVARNKFNGTLSVDDENLALKLDGFALLDGENSHIDAALSVNQCNLANMNLTNKYPDHNLSFKLNAYADGNQMNNLNGEVEISDIRFVDANGEGVVINNFELLADNTKKPYEINLKSDVIDGNVKGYYRFNTIVPTFKHILAQQFPALLQDDGGYVKETILENTNNFKYGFTIKDNDATNSLLTFFKSPVVLFSSVELAGNVDDLKDQFSLHVEAPYLAQKNKLIENSSIYVGNDSIDNNLTLNVKTTMPLKKGKMTLAVDGKGGNNMFNTDVSWVVDREEDFHGNIDLTMNLTRVQENDKLMATIDVNPTTLVFNDTAWYVHDSRIGVYDNNIRVKDFKVTCDKQFIRIDGRTSSDPDDELTVELQDINLDYIFETLQINNVTFGGYATGKIVASELLSKNPQLETKHFFVDGLEYNKTLLGDADIKSYWDNEAQFVAIKADISQPNGCESKVDGEIYVLRDSMRFDFEADKLKVGFMKPFMSAITSDLDGYASGYAQLFGKFSTLNLKGKIFVEDLKVKVDFTNVYYWATDSINIVPGHISFDKVQLKDRYGKTAYLSGFVAHEDFRNASFRFDITDAQDLLCYDFPTKKIDPWYGTIFGNGGAKVVGEPGLVEIEVNMATAADSKFFFELSDEQTAYEYDFVTFTDKRKEAREREERENSQIHNLEQRLALQNKNNVSETSSRVIVDIKADINPLGQLILVMDPVGGDKVKARGYGSLKMKYDSSDELFLQGKYTLEKGTYNFTLQDIIVKDFLINEGSSISFDGNPYDADLNLEAVYPLNANLLDLDESFATDKEFNRTNVPVQALLKVTGKIAEPNVAFDLNFPTLTSDAYRKVKSIISTDDMMNRQIIYLLALNRFYTPEYMGGTNNNNELASVASSTISSQLSNMLGQISDKWRISPNFRSDKGDFSDVEVNLALSSQLLNNRLLLNGNFGYRDKMMSANNSNFIGDFDIEYLLNKSGNVRLKAYNHFNDQNYYVKNALTTQGVGVVFKYDFDKPLDFFKKKKKKMELSLSPDSVLLNSNETK